MWTTSGGVLMLLLLLLLLQIRHLAQHSCQLRLASEATCSRGLPAGSSSSAGPVRLRAD